MLSKVCILAMYLLTASLKSAKERTISEKEKKEDY